jgi:hypothetical protein
VKNYYDVNLFVYIFVLEKAYHINRKPAVICGKHLECSESVGIWVGFFHFLFNLKFQIPNLDKCIGVVSHSVAIPADCFM